MALGEDVGEGSGVAVTVGVGVGVAVGVAGANARLAGFTTPFASTIQTIEAEMHRHASRTAAARKNRQAGRWAASAKACSGERSPGPDAIVTSVESWISRGRGKNSGAARWRRNVKE